MNHGSGTGYLMNINHFFELCFPFLFVTWIINVLVQRAGLHSSKGLLMVPLTLSIAGIITFIPIHGLSLAAWMLSINPVFSVGSICLFLSLIWRQLRGRVFLSGMDLLVFSVWNIAVSLYVSLSYLGFIGYDIYYLGYGFSFFFIVTCSLTIVLFLFRSPVSWIFTAYIIAYSMKVLPTHNYFDYITDVPLFIISLAIVIIYIVKSIVSMSRGKTAAGAARSASRHNAIHD